MAHGTAQVDQSALGQDDDVAVVFQQVAIHLRRRRRIQGQNSLSENREITAVQPGSEVHYLRFDVDLSSSVLVQPAHVDLTVKVTDVTDNGVVLHLFKVPERDIEFGNKKKNA